MSHLIELGRCDAAGSDAQRKACLAMLEYTRLDELGPHLDPALKDTLDAARQRLCKRIH
ncbi:hypothetical protein [Pseudorhodoferax sp. Leaf267]|uniref:hypothetical protein n=1 Tax=Pseudorhodoferax sp. Leaf267 TaxID=1736316 RepID=UPI0012E17C25|nr:hypothetical protein [Pseudorhodoferax sp. Leaf267]